MNIAGYAVSNADGYYAVVLPDHARADDIAQQSHGRADALVKMADHQAAMAALWAELTARLQGVHPGAGMSENP